MQQLELCLPDDLRRPETTIVKVSAGLSGAGVYRVESGGEAFALKVAAEDHPLSDWRARVRVQQQAAAAGLSPRIVHVDEERRAVLSAFVVDRVFPAFYGNPGTRDAALALLAATMRRVHALPLPPDAAWREPRDFLAQVWSAVSLDYPLPSFVADAVQRVLDESPPDREHALVLSHNDANPSNLVYDGENLLLLDWDTAGPNDAYYDLAVLAVFLRMDDETCRRMIAAHDEAVVDALPALFVYYRRLAAALLAAMFMRLARQSGHAGATESDTLDSTPSLVECYQAMRAGKLNMASADGQWVFGLVMAKNSLAL
jgi:aminoglycoside phosphotransferase (APT) family kinase protein